jgi:hypothetical protein
MEGEEGLRVKRGTGNGEQHDWMRGLRRYERSESAKQRAHMRVKTRESKANESAKQRAHMRVVNRLSGPGL